MPFELVRGDGDPTLTLSGAADIFEASAFHAAATEAASLGEHGLVVEMSAVEAVDGAMTQILLALRRAVTARGKTIVLQHVPAGVLERWRLAGLDTELL